MDFDIDDELNEIETLQRNLAELDRIRGIVATEGMSRSIGLGLESLFGGSIPNIDIRKLTVNPSMTNQRLALEAIDWKRMALMVVGFSAVLGLLIKLFQWIFGSSGRGGGGGGGGGSSATQAARKYAEELRKTVADNAERLREEVIEPVRTNPDRVFKAKYIEKQGPTHNSMVTAILAMLVDNDNVNEAQFMLLVMRIEYWFKLFEDGGYYDVNDAIEDHWPPFYAAVWMVRNPDKVIDPAAIAFYDQVPPISEEQAYKYSDSLRRGINKDLDLRRELRDGMTRMVDAQKLEDIILLMEVVEQTIKESDEMMHILRLNIKAGTDPYEDREFVNIVKRVMRQLVGDDSRFARFVEDPNRDREHLLEVLTCDVRDRTAPGGIVTKEIASKRWGDYPYLLERATGFDLAWELMFNFIGNDTINMRIDKKNINETDINKQYFGVVKKHAMLLRHMFMSRDRFLDARQHATSKTLVLYNDDLEKKAKRIERIAEDALTEAKRLEQEQQRIRAPENLRVNSDGLKILQAFLDSIVFATKRVALYTTNVRRAKRGAAIFDGVTLGK